MNLLPHGGVHMITAPTRPGVLVVDCWIVPKATLQFPNVKSASGPISMALQTWKVACGAVGISLCWVYLDICHTCLCRQWKPCLSNRHAGEVLVRATAWIPFGSQQHRGFVAPVVALRKTSGGLGLGEGLGKWASKALFVDGFLHSNRSIPYLVHPHSWMCVCVSKKMERGSSFFTSWFCFKKDIGTAFVQPCFNMWHVMIPNDYLWHGLFMGMKTPATWVCLREKTIRNMDEHNV